jgi:hypothetical protein
MLHLSANKNEVSLFWLNLYGRWKFATKFFLTCVRVRMRVRVRARVRVQV